MPETMSSTEITMVMMSDPRTGSSISSSPPTT